MSIGVLADDGTPFCLNGGPFTSDDVMIAMPGSHLHMHSPVEGAVIAIVVDKDHLQSHPGLSAATDDWLFAADFGAQLLTAPQLARRALRNPDQRHISIGDIAARHDFWNWSQFTRLYQSHFAQLPSDTRVEAGHSI